MAHKPDAVTSWWRRISLRAKVTGVTVAVLALGLLVAGIGTVPILRTALVANIDAQLPALVSSDLAERYFDITVVDGVATYTPRDEQPRDFSFAIYDASGVLQATARGTSGQAPLFPAEYSLAKATADTDQIPLEIPGRTARSSTARSPSSAPRAAPCGSSWWRCRSRPPTASSVSTSASTSPSR
ncbi:hypothetical protein [Microbacterium sp. Se5.02b]|uniref:hypothetical protein n=1 Tax=Microbacterium sp. Se5.02b TaxID=2864103 RepID=UPI001C693D94|nr:hypothetical protein [Microbacterium sp. Se5.02b]QYM63411.1 hypothetical protein K1X59_14485 [Microbacterium sp. Se5.02b]